MKIVALQAENIKRLVAVDIHPESNLVQITGKNGQGKTSVLDSIWWALAGMANVQAEPVRQGEEAARIRLDLGDIVVTRKFHKNEEGETTSSLSVENAEGAKYPSPQKMLDSLLGELSFDPLAFSRMKKAERFEVLKKFVPVDFSALDQANNQDYVQRTEYNRQAKDRRSMAQSIQIPLDAPVEMVDVEKLLKDLKDIGELNQSQLTLKNDRQQLSNKIENLTSGLTAKQDRAKQEIEQLQQRIAEVQDQMEKENRVVTNLIAKAQEELQRMLEPKNLIDVEPIHAEIRNAKQKNELVDRRLKRANLESEAEKYEQLSQELSDKIEARNHEKQVALEQAQFPVSGISLGNGEVLLGSVPFEQASAAEQLRASIEFAMAVNPKLRVLLVRDGSLLDEESLALVAAMSKEKDYQVWMERVDSSGKVGFVIENGQVKA